MSSSHEELEAKVARLETRLETLIENLADNNAQFIEALYALARDKKSIDREAAVRKCESGICPNDPPKCKKKDKD